MAGGKDPYTVGRSQKHPGEWAMFKNGKETKHHSADRATISGKVMRANIKAHKNED